MSNRFHISTGGSPAECVASVRSCPRGGEETYMSSLGLEGPARPSVRTARELGVREELYGGSEVVKPGLKLVEQGDVEEIVIVGESSPGKFYYNEGRENIVKKFEEYEDLVRESEGRDPSSAVHSLALREQEAAVSYYGVKELDRRVEVLNDSTPEERERFVREPVVLGEELLEKVKNRSKERLSEDELKRAGELSAYENLSYEIAMVEPDKNVLKGLEETFPMNSQVGVLLYSRGDYKTDPEELSVLADSDSSFVQAGVALNPNTSVKTLRKLAKSPNDNVQQSVALNPNTPDAVIDSMTRAMNTTEWGYYGLARSGRLTKEQEQVCRDKIVSKTKSKAERYNSFTGRSDITVNVFDSFLPGGKLHDYNKRQGGMFQRVSGGRIVWNNERRLRFWED